MAAPAGCFRAAKWHSSEGCSHLEPPGLASASQGLATLLGHPAGCLTGDKGTRRQAGAVTAAQQELRGQGSRQDPYRQNKARFGDAGHLGASLGVIELTVALHYVFNAPEDKILWDVGHQVQLGPPSSAPLLCHGAACAWCKQALGLRMARGVSVCKHLAPSIHTRQHSRSMSLSTQVWCAEPEGPSSVLQDIPAWPWLTAICTACGVGASVLPCKPLLLLLQTYGHKILTGRRSRMKTIRQTGGLSGFTKRDESEFDAFGAGHSSTSVSAALGMAVGRDFKVSGLGSRFQ